MVSNVQICADSHTENQTLVTIIGCVLEEHKDGGELEDEN